MKIHFYKYHGAGNDFILIDNRENEVSFLSKQNISDLCNRHFGVGADGLMLLNNHKEYDFEMDYYNSDGSGSTMCGNGGRCIVAFAKKLKLFNNSVKFLASDGLHEAEIKENGLIKLKMTNVTEFLQDADNYIVNTGSPHIVIFKDDIENIDVFNEGRKIRNSQKFKENGINVNFVSENDGELSIRTYERGVENETLSCGTGSVASAIAYYKKYNPNIKNIKLKTLGGELNVKFEEKQNGFENVYLEGQAKFVFEGDYYF
ncbi:MAG: diaminopimelate epimerase [Bacteroidales bacterium]|nr:diaminopimelate epimerase [Bacteroidales bacterium]MBN2756216.1 diaminopimelate epimerase [Bacteroidales bacterium]